MVAQVLGQVDKTTFCAPNAEACATANFREVKMKFTGTVYDIVEKSDKLFYIRVMARDTRYSFLCFKYDVVSHLRKCVGKEISLDIYPTREGDFAGKLTPSNIFVSDIWSAERFNRGKKTEGTTAEPMPQNNDDELPF